MARAACPDRRLLESSLRGKARSMLFSNSVVDEFCEEATLPEMRAVEGLLARQMEVRAANQLERRMRRARFPAAKSLDGYDFSQVSFPDGYGEADLRSLAFIDAFVLRVTLSWFLGDKLGWGLYGYILGYALAAYGMAIPGLIYYFFFPWYKRKLVTD